MQIPPRRILLAVTGLTPQVVTETLHALACRVDDAWIPTEIHLITTATGAENARLNLLVGQAWFHRLLADYHLPDIAFPVENIHILRDARGMPLDDIRSPEQNTLAADFITETVRRLTEQPDTELHVSIAGGRKTMGYYLGYALSLYGRPQDRLSHVLVSEPFETNREFYYPTPYDHPIHVKRGDKEVTVDARIARVELADIPFVRLREGLPERLRRGQAGYSQVVAIANRGQEPPRLLLNVLQRRVWVDDEPLSLGATEFVFLLWLAERAQRDEAATDWSTPDMAAEFLAVAARVLNTLSSDYERIENALDWRKSASIKIAKYFEPHKSRVNTAITGVLGKTAATRYAITRIRKNQTTQFFLPLVPDQIEIVNK
ncbi:MAG TPA: CRISPR-associated ring nuclease Csm6 [Thiobacillaceae bacterium]|nr:CRISPR-associated ring nuclease Csm6 [Thiobacillaceae bacterium]HNU63511.1 CRISPR-associated ring nuclease Csm6 [Thiobacillaceae bacterium]